MMTSLHTPYPRLHDEQAVGTGWPVRPTQGMARLSLFINGTAYQLLPLATDGTAAIKAFRLRKFDGIEYDIAQTTHGMTCDCPDFTFKREGIDPRGCKHIKALVECGLIDLKQEEIPPAKTPPARTRHGDGPIQDQSAPPAATQRARCLVPANGQPASFLEIVEHEALGYKAWGMSVGKVLDVNSAIPERGR